MMFKTVSRLKNALLGATMIIAAAGLVAAQSASAADTVQLSVMKGKVAQYSLTPRGDVDGLILTNGTEIHFPPHKSTPIVFSVHPGDAVTVRGEKLADSPTMKAEEVINDTTGVIVRIGRHGPPGQPETFDDESRVKMQLHGPEGDLDGVLLEDGTIVRMPPPDAERHAAILAVGQPLYVRGDGVFGPLGNVISAREIGPTKTNTTKADEVLFERWMHDLFGGRDPSPSPAVTKTP